MGLYSFILIRVGRGMLVFFYWFGLKENKFKLVIKEKLKKSIWYVFYFF